MNNLGHRVGTRQRHPFLWIQSCQQGTAQPVSHRDAFPAFFPIAKTHTVPKALQVSTDIKLQGLSQHPLSSAEAFSPV